MFYPAHLNIAEMKITIIGGGNVALRKCKFFIENNKQVTVVAKKFISEFGNFKDKLELIEDVYDESYIRESQLVIAATDHRELNQKIGQRCRTLQILVNVVDDYKLSTFIVPAVVQRGDLLLSVSTHGKSPSLAGKIKRELAMAYDDSYGYYVELLGQARQLILETIDDPGARKEKLNNLIQLTTEELEAILWQ